MKENTTVTTNNIPRDRIISDLLGCHKDGQLSLYIHIPFCVKKCLYCDFLSGPYDQKKQEAYVDALLLQIEKEAPDYKEYQIISIFFGGGTPSLLEIPQMNKIMTKLKKVFFICEDAEITIEANPGTLGYAKLIFYRKVGINRISIGLQSSHNEELKILGRIHTYEEFLENYQNARKAGFQNINIDLMSALPGQTVEAYEETLIRICSLKPEHISAYSLIIEEGTPFFDKKLDLPNEEVERLLYEKTGEILEKYGYYRYEISNYSKQGYESRHNSIYWTRGNYLGFGLGAASMVCNVRWNNPKEMEEYCSGTFDKNQIQHLSRNEQMEEFMFLGLRRMEGIRTDTFSKFFEKTPEDVYGKQIEKLKKEGLLVETSIDKNRYLKLTKRGIDLSNYVFEKFLF